ncbi:MAG: hypothetical protein LLF82_000449 [Dehalococcoides mccartyi]|uniref:Uncharacterized protein n=1 Tax=Dehalococcoides mccartyi TaxID=61435 RepID=A0A0V8M4G2_9CHLR|nr:hypothetical protein [Dehalococcoides mccartyi]KSV18608.1 hypothetical protein DA01_01135 [Dehalococcoides mccartyi]MCF7634983.1 hypothetical protein [Dehalococcoides mccartyi]MEA2121404.1 hypothetical protein [Dehalococcoides mccartyi]MEA2123185.1 hypothetical protein [Dehalococcoides mccartyi]
MYWPPMLLWAGIPFGKGGGSFPLILPLFLIYPIVLALMIVFAPFMLLAILLTWSSGKGRFLLLIGPYSYRLWCALRGMNADIRDNKTRIKVQFI